MVADGPQTIKSRAAARPLLLGSFVSIHSDRRAVMLPAPMLARAVACVGRPSCQRGQARRVSARIAGPDLHVQPALLVSRFRRHPSSAKTGRVRAAADEAQTAKDEAALLSQDTKRLTGVGNDLKHP